MPGAVTATSACSCNSTRRFRQRYAARKDAQVPDYVGLDFVPAALSQATKNFAQVQEALQEQFRTRFRTFVPMSMQVCRADLESPLPFPDHSFDRVICNLVIGYVRDPLFTLREYLRAWLRTAVWSSPT